MSCAIAAQDRVSYTHEDNTLRARAVWVSWEHQRRNQGIASALGVPFHEIDLKHGRFARYALSLLKTWRMLRSERPSVIFVQNPSIVLAIAALIYGRLQGVKIVVDAHNVALVSLERSSRSPLAALYRLAVRCADLTVVTNNRLATLVSTAGGRPFVLPDRIPEFPPAPQLERSAGEHSVLFICTFASDEPYREVIEAARQLDSRITVYITGNPKHRRAELKAIAPSNVIFTGFVSEEDYVALLQTVDVVMDLTTRADCLVCGAYEAVAAERPLILSDNRATRAYFDRGVRYTDNSAVDLARAVREVLHSADSQQLAIRELKSRLKTEWSNQLKAFISRLENIVESQCSS
jgi:glycosyltransferase involved in cell wall biosynthesis